MTNTPLYTWNFPDVKNRWSLWYIIALSLVIGLVIWGFLTKQYGMSFILLLITGIAYFVENNSDDEVTVEISELWIRVGWTFYDFSRIPAYAFIYDGDNAIFLRLNLAKKWVKQIDLKVNNEITTELKQILPRFIEENPKQDLSFLERMIHLLKL